MEVINVRGQLTLEKTAVQVTFLWEELILLSQNEPRTSEEGAHYQQLESQLAYEYSKAMNKADDNSRQVRVVHEATDGWPCCISVVQLLVGDRDRRQLVCYWRSSSADFLPSDLGFLARVGLKYEVDELVCFMASLHIELMKHPDPPATKVKCDRCKGMFISGGIHVCV